MVYVYLLYTHHSFSQGIYELNLSPFKGLFYYPVGWYSFTHKTPQIDLYGFLRVFLTCLRGLCESTNNNHLSVMITINISHIKPFKPYPVGWYSFTLKTTQIELYGFLRLCLTYERDRW